MLNRKEKVEEVKNKTEEKAKQSATKMRSSLRSPTRQREYDDRA